MKKIYDRGPIYAPVMYESAFAGPDSTDLVPVSKEIVSYRRFRKQVGAGPGCVMIYWCGMWLGIEPDGYTHS